jgi:competence protein ComEC
VSTKFFFAFLIILFSVFLLRFFLQIKTKQTGQTISIVQTEPKFKKGLIYFRINHEFVYSKKTDLHAGDKIKTVIENNGSYLFAAKIEKLDQGFLINLAKTIKENLEKRIDLYFPSPQGELLKGILLGVKEDLPKDFNQALIATGTIHIVVVSGYNISLIGGFFLSLASLIGRKKASVLSLLAIIIYAALVGNSPPTLRAALIGIIGFSAVILGRQYQALIALLIAALVMLAFDPLSIFDISSQLTFMSTLGVIIFTKALEKGFSRLPKLVNEPLATTLAAQLLVIPIIFYYFGTFSISSPLVNLLVLWMIPLVTIIGFLFLIVSLFSSLFASLISFVIMIPLTYFVIVVKYFASFNYLYLMVSFKDNWKFVFSYYLFIASLYYFLKIAKQEKTKKEIDLS